MVFAQGALGYGLTSIMGAAALKIFRRGQHQGSIFGVIMLAGLAGGAAPLGGSCS